ncbi:CynX/NimT family MFS transporter [Microlunatus sp. Y2014]|uniref:CynX/NimT family MFS transporter n=1 Tax=Microlunatus sp. Y2014 TaxID=3418488 RepID=UPI003DA747EF
MSRPAAALLGIVLVASCLRPPITGVGPLIPMLGNDLGLDNTALGVLGALPLLGFAVTSMFVHLLAARLGVNRAVALALVGLALGMLLRSGPLPAGLWIGTVVIGGTIAIGNVLLPAIVKRDYASHLSLATGVYTSVMSGMAGVGAGLAVPITAALDGNWRLTLAVWVALCVAALLAWLPRLRRSQQPPVARAVGRADPPVTPTSPPEGSGRGMWRSPLAWLVTGFMALQSTVFYLVLTWLVTMEGVLGIPPAEAGWHLFGVQAVAIPSGLVVSAVMHRLPDQRALAAGCGAAIGIATLGGLFAPQLLLLWLALLGVGTGSSFVVAMSLVAMRTRTAAQTAQLTGMAQSVGYLLACIGPVLAGWLSEVTGSWGPVLVLLAALAAGQGVIGFAAGRPRFIS